ncbi:MAG: hypothetical protein ONB53_20940 [candidate division KSB1 bacterium]|nr:hypothetical protein [candidate division KSB1 bacterium]MDZ7354357.1 hypothetical protein [candidate division KSB1 bacterium]MDZ7384256.1 hypothetical protein [candidate division KSB1 bacterium]MDZ7395219.1 hypothetical protein [candidate division KSB1 bacterium]MDZ7411777.1 hypothetical protein [candidate division KSB1 bacterium]
MALSCDPGDALCSNATAKPWQIKKGTELSPQRFLNHAIRQEHEGNLVICVIFVVPGFVVWQLLQKNFLRESFLLYLRNW